MSDIVVKNLCKSFGEKQVIKDFSHEFSSGGHYLIKANSGIGKTTLLRILAGLEKCDSGEMTGINRVMVSFCFQEDRLLEDISAIDNLLLVVGSSVSKEYAINLLTELGLENEDIIKSVNTFSGGMKRRVALARAILYALYLKNETAESQKNNEKAEGILLLLDEPFAGLDRENRDRAVRFIEKYSKDITLIIASHEVDDETFDDIAMIELQSNI